MPEHAYPSSRPVVRGTAARVATLAACSLALGAASVAQAPAAELRPAAAAPAAVTITVSRSAETAAFFTTVPKAHCLIGDAAARPMPVDADDAGTVRMHARTSPSASPIIHLAAACDAAGRHYVVPINVRSVGGVVRNAMPRPVTDPAFHLPTGFDPAYAGSAELARYGFPPRPDRLTSPGAYAQWLRGVEGGAARVAPTGVRTDRTGALANEVRVKPDAAGKQYNTANWSGIVATNVVTDELEGTWTVPVVQITQSDSPGYSSMWIGIDGFQKSKDLYQTGTEQDAYWASGVELFNYYAWYEFVPEGPGIKISNFVVSPGDVMFAMTWYCPTSVTMACFTIDDITENESASEMTVGPSNPTFNSAEWVLERPTVRKQLWALPNYIYTESSGMYLWDVHKSNFYKYEVYPHGHIYMYHNGNLLSKAAGTSNGSGADYYWENFL